MYEGSSRNYIINDNEREVFLEELFYYYGGDYEDDLCRDYAHAATAGGYSYNDIDSNSDSPCLKWSALGLMCFTPEQ